VVTCARRHAAPGSADREGVACRPRRRPPCGAAARQATAPTGPSLKILGARSRHSRRQHSSSRAGRVAIARRHLSGSLFQGAMCQRGCLLPFPRPNPSVHPSITPVLRPSHQMSTHELAPSLSCPAHLSQPRHPGHEKVHGSWAPGSCPCPPLPYLACSSSQAIVTAMQRGAMPRRRDTRQGALVFRASPGQGRRGYCTGACPLRCFHHQLTTHHGISSESSISHGPEENKMRRTGTTTKEKEPNE
jgi:hypothetical protein